MAQVVDAERALEAVGRRQALRDRHHARVEHEHVAADPRAESIWGVYTDDTALCQDRQSVAALSLFGAVRCDQYRRALLVTEALELPPCSLEGRLIEPCRRFIS